MSSERLPSNTDCNELKGTAGSRVRVVCESPPSRSSTVMVLPSALTGRVIDSSVQPFALMTIVGSGALSACSSGSHGRPQWVTPQPLKSRCDF